VFVPLCERVVVRLFRLKHLVGGAIQGLKGWYKSQQTPFIIDIYVFLEVFIEGRS
jgi:hypothetical protein